MHLSFVVDAPEFKGSVGLQLDAMLIDEPLYSSQVHSNYQSAANLDQITRLVTSAHLRGVWPRLAVGLFVVLRLDSDLLGLLIGFLA